METNPVRSLTDEQVLRALLHHRRLTRAELAAEIGVSKPTAGESVRRLTERGLLADTGERTPGGRGKGRVGQYYALADPGSALVIGIAPTGVAAELIDAYGDTLARATRPIDRPAHPAAVVRALQSVTLSFGTPPGVTPQQKTAPAVTTPPAPPPARPAPPSEAQSPGKRSPTGAPSPDKAPFAERPPTAGVSDPAVSGGRSPGASPSGEAPFGGRSPGWSPSGEASFGGRASGASSSVGQAPTESSSGAPSSGSFAAAAFFSAVRPRLAVVSAADPVDRATGRLVQLPDAPFLVGSLDPVAVLSDYVDGPVVVDNDVNWAARAEPASSDFAYLFLGEGLGCAIVSDGSVQRGRSGLAGEIAHILTVGRDGRATPFIEVFRALGLRRPDSSAIDVGRLLAAPVADRRAIGKAVAGVVAAIVALADPAEIVLGGAWGPALLVEIIAAVAGTPRPLPVRASAVTGESSLAAARQDALDRLRAQIVDSR
ncbi:ROK family transcriptional regulator [Actinoplanes sp. NPDC051411]|uniref:ROK family transcriptional regulator n=1 Tax=Actinoplanes sp. NPDC051411 TaxID=3155522 RepID=UPI00343766F3